MSQFQLELDMQMILHCLYDFKSENAFQLTYEK